MSVAAAPHNIYFAFCGMWGRHPLRGAYNLRVALRFEMQIVFRKNYIEMFIIYLCFAIEMS